MNDAEPRSAALRIAVLLSGGGSTLGNLIECIADGRLRGVQIVQVVSSRSDVRGVSIARHAGLPLAIIRQRDFADNGAFSDAISRVLDEAQVDLIVMGGFLCLWLIPARYEGRVLNIHPGPLPAFGGRGMHGHHVHDAVLRAGLAETCCTVHLADNQYDHGPIIARQCVRIEPADTPETLATRVMAAERELYPAVIQRVAEEGVEWLAFVAAGRTGFP